MQKTNDYELGVMNGDIGTIKQGGKKITVEINGRDIEYDHDKALALEPAYAISIHKSQGSEYPAIIIGKGEDGNILVSIVEYKGDYIWLSIVDVKKAELKAEEKLSILAMFGDFFYGIHREFYQELIIETIHIY